MVSKRHPHWATAGATSVELDVNGQTQNPQVCPANASNGTFVVPLADAGSYTVDGFLFSGNTLLSEVHPPTFTVSCADLTTPAMIFPVNL